MTTSVAATGGAGTDRLALVHALGALRARRSIQRCRNAVPTLVRRLALMLRAGMDLGSALEALERGAADDAIRALIADVRKRVNSGVSFAAALQARPDIFPAPLIASAVAAEASGQLGTALEQTARALEEERRLRKTVRGLLIYPCALLALSVLVVVALLVFVLPRFREIFESAGVPLPLTTRLLLAVSDFVVTHPWMVAGSLFAILVCTALGFQHPALRSAVRETLTRLPLVGRVLTEIALGRIFHSLGSMLQNGVPLLEALNLTMRSTDTPRLADLLKDVIESVTSGAGIAGPLRKNPLCPPETAEIVATAERSGALAWALCFVGQIHQEEGESKLRTYVRLLEPCLIIFLGLVVALIVSSVMLPLFDLSRVAGA